MMKKISCIILTVVCAFAISTAAMADTAITVSGTGETLVDADSAVISLGVNVRNKDVIGAQAKVNETIAAIRDALEENGIARENVNTDYINIYAIYDYNGDQEEVTAYNANCNLAIKTDDMDLTGRIIDIAFEAGANTLNGIFFSATDTSAANEEALKMAVEDAKKKAQVLAEASGLTITGISNVTETGTYSYDRGVANNFAVESAKAAADSGTVVQAAKLTVSASVNITFNVE